MERVPFEYILLAVALWVALVFGWFLAWGYFRNRPAELSGKDKLIGFFLAGPFFGPLHSRLSAKGYVLSARERTGLLIIGAVVIVIIVGALIDGYTRT